MTQTCIICHKSNQEKIILNDLALLRCRQCGLIRREAFDMPVTYYEELDAGDTPEKREIRFRNSIDRIKLFSRFVPRTGWCDIGTGEGIFLEALAAEGGRGVGIEPSEESCKKATEHGVRIVGHTIEDISSVLKEDPTIKTISLFHVIEHLEHPDEEIKRIYDALPLGGFLIIETPNIDSPVFKLRKYKDPLIYPEHLWYFSKNTLNALLRKNGFNIVASGGRDFDQYNLPIRESLFRLGLSAHSPPKVARKYGNVLLEEKPSRNMVTHDGSLRVLIRCILSHVVAITNKSQYVWIVAQKYT